MVTREAEIAHARAFIDWKDELLHHLRMGGLTKARDQFMACRGAATADEFVAGKDPQAVARQILSQHAEK